MIIPSKTKILIVPDFGVSTDTKAMIALKQTIEAKHHCAAKTVDLKAEVLAEHSDESIKDSDMIELAARKLEVLAGDENQVWDTLEDDDFDDPIRSFLEENIEDVFEETEQEIENHDEQGNPDEIMEEAEKRHISRHHPPLKITVTKGGSDSGNEGAPDALVVFGKSAMLAGGVKDMPILVIDPEYDSEWPWKKQYYADQKLAEQYHCDKYEYERGFMETVLPSGAECTRPWQYSRRYGLITSADYIGEFRERYPCMAEVNRGLDGDTDGLAKFICDFADDKLTNPLDEVYEAIENLPRRDIPNLNVICDFFTPVQLGNVIVPGLRFGAPMAKGQSCYKLNVAGLGHTLPLECVQTRRELNALRDAIVRAGERMSTPPQKRILIVPDYFTPYNAPNVKELYERLRQRGYYVAVYVNGESLEKSRAGIERRCKVKPFDLVVTLETGCLVAGRVANCPRVMVNPDWVAWEWMGLRLGEDKQHRECRGIDNSEPFYEFYLNREEVAMARHMAERSYFKRSDKLVYGWFTDDAVESHLSEEHIKRFNTGTYIPGLRLDTEEGIDILARQIDNILTVDDDV